MSTLRLALFVGKLIGLGGGLRERSFSSATLQAGMAMAEDLGITTETSDWWQLDLSMYVPEQALQDYPRPSGRLCSVWSQRFAAQMPRWGAAPPTTAA